MTEATRRPGTRRGNDGGVVDAVRSGSIADEIGLQPGDHITEINGHTLRDAVDFQFHAADEALTLHVVRGGELEIIEIEKDADEELGIGFQDAAFDGVRTCNNGCFFCFLKGNPRGMRKTLYVKDDDYRLSFYHGNFVTLTNLTDEDWQRIGDQRLSPLNVSVHATDLELRRYLLGNKTAPDIIPQLRRLVHLGIDMNTQVVLCPGVNDGAALERTIGDLAALHPAVQTISVVPVGETLTAEERISRGQHAAETNELTPAYARDIIAQISAHQRRMRQAHGRTLVYLADEFYLAAGAPLPSSAHYDGFPQYENGIGMTRSLIVDWQRTKRRLARAGVFAPAVKRATIACGALIGGTLRDVASEVSNHTGVQIDVHAIENTFFGPRVNVSGLLVAEDIERALRGRDLGAVCILPRYALDYTGHRFLDDRTPDDLAAALGVKLAFASTFSEVLQILGQPLESQQAAGPASRSNGKSWVDWQLEAPVLGGRGLAKEARR